MGGAVLAFALCTGCGSPKETPPGAAASAPTPTGPSACGRIAYASSVGDAHAHSAIAIVPASGGSSVELTAAHDDERSQFPAAVSPDGTTLLVLRSMSTPGGKTSDSFALAELAELPTALRPVGPKGAVLRNPAWAPDGSWLAFESDAESFRDLYRLDLASDQTLRLTNDPEGNFEPAVSPEGQRVAFVSSRDGNAEIYVMSADGGSPRRLTESPGDDSAPTWSPDGELIAFASSRDRTRGIDVFLMDAEGGDQRPALPKVTRERGIMARDLRFSPDGEALAFTELAPGLAGATLVIVNIATGALVMRSEPGPRGTLDEQPSWSPDGAFLAFARSSEAGAISHIGRMRSDGTEVELLTHGEVVHWLPRWIPDERCPRVEPRSTPMPASERG